MDNFINSDINKRLSTKDHSLIADEKSYSDELVNIELPSTTAMKNPINTIERRTFMAPESQRIKSKLVKRGCWGDENLEEKLDDQLSLIKQTTIAQHLKRATSTVRVKDLRPSTTFTQQGRTLKKVAQDSSAMPFFSKGIDNYMSVSPMILASK